ncbi:MAG: alpha/beta hydrolase fold domain-containing protein [Oligoflexia bacterium]|nr:alpha/beta hydrolase fold domain-containing protein [Oligoflexia bacterium]
MLFQSIAAFALLLSLHVQAMAEEKCPINDEITKKIFAKLAADFQGGKIQDPHKTCGEVAEDFYKEASLKKYSQSIENICKLFAYSFLDGVQLKAVKAALTLTCNGATNEQQITNPLFLAYCKAFLGTALMETVEGVPPRLDPEYAKGMPKYLLMLGEGEVNLNLENLRGYHNYLQDIFAKKYECLDRFMAENALAEAEEAVVSKQCAIPNANFAPLTFFEQAIASLRQFFPNALNTLLHGSEDDRRVANPEGGGLLLLNLFKEHREDIVIQRDPNVGVTLKGDRFTHLCKEGDRKGVVTIFSGSGGPALSYLADTINTYQHHCYDVDVVDYRAYGESTGELPSELEIAADAYAVFQYSQAALAKGEQHIIHGFSFGGIVASMLYVNLQEEEKERVAKIILDRPMTSLHRAAAAHMHGVATAGMIANRSLGKYSLRDQVREEKIKAKDLESKFYIMTASLKKDVLCKDAEAFARKYKVKKYSSSEAKHLDDFSMQLPLTTILKGD